MILILQKCKWCYTGRDIIDFHPMEELILNIAWYCPMVTSSLASISKFISVFLTVCAHTYICMHMCVCKLINYKKISVIFVIFSKF